MDLPYLVLVLLLTFLAYRADIVFYRLCLHPLAKFPGPRLAAATTLWRAYHQIWRDGKLLHTTRELHKRYGPVIRISPNELDFCDPAAYFEIYNHTFNGIKDPDFYRHLQAESGTETLLTVDGDPAKHKAHLRPVATLFSARAYQKHDAYIVEKVERFTNLLFPLADKHQVCSLAQGFTSLTVAIMYDFIFSEIPDRFKALQSPFFDDPLASAVVNSLNWTSWFIRNFPTLSDIVLKLPPSLVAFFTSSFDGANRMFGILADIVEHEKTLKADTNPDCVSQRLLAEHTHNGTLSPAADSTIRSEAVGFMLAGTIDPANILSLCTFMIARNDSLQTRLYHELKTAWPDLEGNMPSVKVLRSLPMLRGTIQEGLRLTGGVATGPPRLVGKGGARIAGYNVPEGAVVAVPSYYVHCDPNVFANPDEFLPDRWADDDRANHLVAFSRGRRMCPAEQYTVTMLATTLASIFRRFKVEPYETTVKDYVWNQYISVMFTGRPLRAKLERRRE